eukprot:TRINITY_DN2396_c0_g1_i1.p1 TRINITY_DN2396_c0_g1~~TRINITY_DN2396_c0_g1_i1.p1  ORF type:complete len:416 (-),score=92.49 TRINITY_DN2396_c0_g1_i1:244-1491(-)
MRLKKVACFISDHGLGHASRCCAVITELCNRGAMVLVVGTIPDWFFRESCPKEVQKSIEYYRFKTEVGTFQRTSVDIDPDKTLSALNTYWHSTYPKEKPLLVEKLRDWKTEIIYFDITATAPLVATELGIPSVAVTNFSFDFIYSEYVEKYPAFKEYVNICSNAYKKADVLLRLPYPCDLSSFDNCRFVKDLGAWICRPAVHSKEHVRKVLIDTFAKSDGYHHHCNGNDSDHNSSDSDDDKCSANDHSENKFLLLSFGGHDFPIAERLEHWQIPQGWTVVFVDHALEKESCYRAKSGAMVVSQALLRSKQVNYVDLVNAMDVIMMKTGYGIVSEVIVHGVCTLYVDRPGFQEHLFLEKALKENLSCARVETHQVFNGTFFEDAQQVYNNRHKNNPNVPSNGAYLAADFLLKMIVK